MNSGVFWHAKSKFYCFSPQTLLLYHLICINQDGQKKSLIYPPDASSNLTSTKKRWILVYFDMLSPNLGVSVIKLFLLYPLISQKQDGHHKSYFSPSHPSNNATTTKNKRWILAWFDMLNINLAISDHKSYSFTSLLEKKKVAKKIVNLSFTPF